MPEIIPSIITQSQRELEEKIGALAGVAKRFQLDIMDGVFVPNQSLTFDFKLPSKNYHFEAHLMVKDPNQWIKNHWKKATTILSPIESCQNPAKIIKFLKGKKRKVGFALNPGTPWQKLKDYLGKIDQVLILTVEPGFYGGKFLPEVLAKVTQIRKLKPDLDIEVDGGVNPKTIKMILEAGANLLVAGSYIFTARDPKKAFATLKKLSQKVKQ